MKYSCFFILVVAALQSCLLAVNGCPNIVSRSEWGARSPSGSKFMSTPVDYFVVHHTAGASCSDISSCSSVMRGIQNYHMDSNGWWDIGYNFLIGGDGNVYEGRGWDTTGAHAGVAEYNTNSIGVSMMGEFSSSMPTQAALQALDDFVTCAITMGKLVPDVYAVLGHQDVKSTSCPGTLFYLDHVQQMTNYNGPSLEECIQ
ncbi:peptidoglycan-recognition protein SC2-like [Apostichopus japonicus]|uniref:peptidoglycan-recognition protein SC2-like n=1 Tax=Stichopus japonicus TaxID=307972 RepID=UPI003AB5D84A